MSRTPTAGGRGHAARDAAVVLGGYLLLGLLCGVLWWLLVDPPGYVKAPDGGATMPEPEVHRRFDVDGWYVVLAATVGTASGLLLTWWRSRDHLLTTLLVAAGALLAAGVAAGTGRWLGPGPVEPALAAAEAGERVPVPLELSATAGYLVWPIAALVGALMVLWSSPAPAASRDHPTPQAPSR